MQGLRRARSCILSQHKFTAITGVNTLFNGLLNTPGFSELDFSHLKLSLGGGMAVQRPVAEKWQKVTNSKLMEGYGLTECSPLVTISPSYAFARRRLHPQSDLVY